MTTTKAKKAPAKGYAGHKEGSRKATVHEVFDNQGPEAAFTRGIKLKLSENTLHSWIATWRRAGTPVKKKAVKPTAIPAAAQAATAPTT
jgi:hypothetical protein